MATQEMILKLSFDDEGTFTGLEDINQELAKTDAATTQLEKSTKTLKAQYAELKKQQDQFDPGTEKFNELSQKMGELKDRMNDAAEAVKGNTGPAIEGMSNTFGIMGEQLSNLDFDGLTQSIKTFSGNLSRIDTKALGGSLKSMLQAGVQGFKALGAAILANPIFFLVGVIIAIIAYWKELNDFISNKSGMIASLNEQLASLKAQEDSLTRQLALQKARGLDAGLLLKTEIRLLETKQKQAEAAIKLAQLEEDKDALYAAQQQKLTAINDLKIRDAKIVDDAYEMVNKIRAANDDDYNKQVLKGKIADEYYKSIAELGVLQEKNSQEYYALQWEIQKLQDAGETSGIANLERQKKQLENKNAEFEGMKGEIRVAWDAATANVKTEKELKAIEDAKAKAAKNKSDAEAAYKKLREEVLAIEQRIAEVQRAGMDDQEKELFAMFEKQKLEEKTFIKAKKSASELAELRATHQIEFEAITAKYDKIEQDKDDAKLLKEREAAQIRLHQKQAELIELQAIIDTADEANFQAGLSKQAQELMASQDYYFELKTQAEAAGLDTTALVEEQARKEREIKKTYLDKEEEDRQKSQDFRNNQIKESLTALIALNESFTARTEKTARRQFGVNKALAMASSLFDTYVAINKALKDETMPSTTARIIQASIVGVMGFANVAKIAKTQFGGGTPDTSMNTPAGGGNNQTNAPAIDFSGANLQVNAPGSTETYVLAGNVANALEARQKIIDQSHL
jgi:hypothetical protein